VSSARVRVGDRVVGQIGHGLLVFLGIGRDDGEGAAPYIASKILGLRVFDGEGGRPMDRSVGEVGGSVLLVSQFTLYGDVRKGRRPSFDRAAPPDGARERYEAVVRELRGGGAAVETGEFRAMMQVESINDGPVTVLIDSERQF